MNKKEESVVKLDLGDDEDEQEEVEEEESAQDQIEEDEEEEVVDFDEEPEEENNVIENNNIVVNKKHESPDRTVKTKKKVNNKKPKINDSATDKSVLTRISEDIFNNLLNSRDKKHKKQSAYDYFVSQSYLDRVVEKGDPECQLKFRNFVQRNKEYCEKKSTRLGERIQNIHNEINANCTGIPNGKVFQKEDIRTPLDYFKDQINFNTTRNDNINKLREDMLINTNSNLTSAPVISKKSKELAEKRQSDNSVKEIYDRLFQEKLNKEKKHIYSEKKGNNKEENKTKLKPKTKVEICNLVNKLYTDALDRKKKKPKYSEIKELHNMYDSNDDLTSNSTKTIILEKFIQNLEKLLNTMFNKKNSVLINFEEYSRLMRSLGFLRYEHSFIEIEEAPAEDEKVKKEKLKQEKELSLLKDAWKILSSGAEDIKDESRRIDTNQFIVFCASLLGVYKGKEEENDEKKKEEDKFQTVKEKFKSPTKKHAKAMSQNYNTFHAFGNKESSEFKSKKDPFKTVIPELDLNIYFYVKLTVKQIKRLFRSFYDNRTDFLSSEKRKTRTEKLNSTISNSMSTTGFLSSNKMKKSAESFKKRLYEQIEQMEIQEENPGEEAKSFIDRIKNKNRKLKMEEVYDILRKKKENDLAKNKQDKELEELKDCTFQPNISKRKTGLNTQNTFETLFQDASKRKRGRSEENVKTEEKPNTECTFSPKINNVNTLIFEVNPLLHDERVKKEMERLQNSRIERKIAEYKKEKGMNNTKNIDIAALVHDDKYVAGWRFDVEKKFFKDPIETLTVERKRNKSQFISRRDFNKTFKFKMNKSPLFNVEVNLDDGTRVEKLEIYPNDNPKDLAFTFAKQHNLSDDKKEKLEKIIEEKLQ